METRSPSKHKHPWKLCSWVSEEGKAVPFLFGLYLTDSCPSPQITGGGAPHWTKGGPPGREEDAQQQGEEVRRRAGHRPHPTRPGRR